MNVVDSSGWLEYLGGGPNVEFFGPPIQSTDELLVPVIVVYEVFKRVLQQHGEKEAEQAMSFMRQGTVIDLDQSLALAAARLSVNLKLPMADSIILATARAHDATIWTQDVDFKDLPGVQYVEKSVQ